MKRFFAWFSPSGMLLIIIGCLIIVFAFFIKDMSVAKSERCTFETEAVVDQIAESFNYDNKRTYMPIYSYFYNGESMTTHGPISQKKPNVKEGETVKFFINPDDPEDYFCPKEEKGDNFAFIVLVFMGVACFAGAIESIREEYRKNTKI